MKLNLPKGALLLAADGSGTAGRAVAATDSRLMTFGASGTGHKAGLVPDPGASAGTTKFLREDGTFATPTSGVSLPNGGATGQILAKASNANGDAQWIAPPVNSTPGTDGNDGWTPVLATVADGARFVHQIADWVGGEGTKPATGKYVGATGLVTAIADGVNVRGATGADGGGSGASFDVRDGWLFN